MKIAIISDTHDNVATFKKAVDLIKKEKIKTIIHCGDIFKPEKLNLAIIGPFKDGRKFRALLAKSGL